MVYKEGLIRNSIDYELAFYIAHGIDHLNGNDDNTDKKAENAQSREQMGLKLQKMVFLILIS